VEGVVVGLGTLDEDEGDSEVGDELEVVEDVDERVSEDGLGVEEGGFVVAVVVKVSVDGRGGFSVEEVD